MQKLNFWTQILSNPRENGIQAFNLQGLRAYDKKETQTCSMNLQISSLNIVFPKKFNFMDNPREKGKKVENTSQENV